MLLKDIPVKVFGPSLRLGSPGSTNRAIYEFGFNVDYI